MELQMGGREEQGTLDVKVHEPKTGRSEADDGVRQRVPHLEQHPARVACRGGQGRQGREPRRQRGALAPAAGHVGDGIRRLREEGGG